MYRVFIEMVGQTNSVFHDIVRMKKHKNMDINMDGFGNASFLSYEYFFIPFPWGGDGPK